MNEELEKQLAEMLKKSMELAEKTGQFVIDQAPDLLQEFYRWHMAQDIFYIVSALLLNSIWLLFTNKNIREYNKDIDYFLSGVFCLPTFLSLILILINILDLLKLILAPKLYLIEYFLWKNYY